MEPTIIPPATNRLPWTVRLDGRDHYYDTQAQAEQAAAGLADETRQARARDRRRTAILLTAQALDLTDDPQTRLLQFQALTRLLRRHGLLEPIRLLDAARPLIIMEGRRFDSYETFARHTLGETTREDA